MHTFRRYFSFPKPTENDMSISVHSLGHHIHLASTPYPDMSHPESHYFSWENGRYLKEYQLLYIAKGSGVFEAQGTPPKTVEAGDMILLFPNIWHRYKPTEKDGWEEYWVGFSGGYAKHLLEQECFSSQYPIINVGLSLEITASFEKLLETMDAPEEKRKLVSFILIQLLGIVYTSVLISNQNLSKKDKIIDDVKKEMLAGGGQKMDFETLAAQYNVSYSWLRKNFKEQTGTSLNQYLIDIQIRKAEQLLTETDLTLSEIASACYFESLFYFSRIFKQKIGLAPSQLRLKSPTAKSFRKR